MTVMAVVTTVIVAASQVLTLVMVMAEGKSVPVAISAYLRPR